MGKEIIFTGAAIVIYLALAGSIDGQSGSRLRYPFKAGEKVTVVQTETSQDTEEDFINKTSSKSSSMREIAQVWDIQSVTPAGEASIILKYSGIKILSSPAPGITLVIDTSKSIKDANPLLVEIGPQAAPLIEKLEMTRKLISDLFVTRTYTLVVSDSGIVRSVGGFEEAMDNYRIQVSKLVPDKAKRATIDASIEAFFGEDSVNKTFSYTIFTPLPKENIAVGKTWSDSTTFSIASIQMPLKRSFELDAVSANADTFTIAGQTDFLEPTATEEIKFKLPKGTLRSKTIFGAAPDMMQSQDYEGEIQLEAYRIGDESTGIAMRFSSKLTGTVRMTRTKASAH